ncbi:hypothetical protein [Paucibacter sp. Y2R2-4]|jgi:hypothetical protein|uniref:hypothetical protein n=1 Tax=Paucibacter sp. Y2R2-4 TaxID=2893553 RepID=UPI0021E35CAD|nr:hypothetical protein [Paucibacter sp. Y2R2-4]MCV2348277.1 hypothetical protein [Paucibacter sp. Y2R2-4]
MLNTQIASPFAMLLNPEQVLRAMEHSDRLNRLHSRVYRPLDKPLIAKNKLADADFDRMVDEAEDEDLSCVDEQDIVNA